MIHEPLVWEVLFIPGMLLTSQLHATALRRLDVARTFKLPLAVPYAKYKRHIYIPYARVNANPYQCAVRAVGYYTSYGHFG